jgi:hypothetical protein
MKNACSRSAPLYAMQKILLNCTNALFEVDKILFKDYRTSSLLQAGLGLQAFNNYNAVGTWCFLVSPKRSQRGTTDRNST